MSKLVLTMWFESVTPYTLQRVPLIEQSILCREQNAVSSITLVMFLFNPP